MSPPPSRTPPTPASTRPSPRGRLTADQAAQAKTASDKRIDQLVNRVTPDAAQGPCPGFSGPGAAPVAPASLRPWFRCADLNAAATAIGIPADQLRTELQGKSLADVATAHGKSANDVATALKNAAHTRIDQAVTAPAA